jgi:IrrE N-terminal-like domain
MSLNEFSTVLKAREFVRKANPTAIPVPLDVYLTAAGATSREVVDMEEGEAGMCFTLPDGTCRICLNAKDAVERRRFTLCHEIAHIVLKLRSDHSTQPWTTGRPLVERLCDLFAVELLLPDRLFQSAAEDAPVSLAGVDGLAVQFEASVTATGSRFADTVSAPCAFVLSHKGRVVHVSRSKPLRDGNAFIARQMELPERSASARVRAGSTAAEHEIDAADWFTDWERGGVLQEEARHLSRWDRTLTLLRFQGQDVPAATARARQEYRWEVEGRDDGSPREPEDESGLRELDGNLRWPGKSRRP